MRTEALARGEGDTRLLYKQYLFFFKEHSRIEPRSREVLRVRFPEDIGHITDERHDADDDIHHDVEQHSQLNHARNAHLVRLHEHRARDGEHGAASDGRDRIIQIQ